jgi:fumarate hydratase class I
MSNLDLTFDSDRPGRRADAGLADGRPANRRAGPDGWGGGCGHSLSDVTDFSFTELLPLGPDATTYRKLDLDGVSTFEAQGHTFLSVEPRVLTELTAIAMHDIAHFLRSGHLAQLRRILDDPEASANDRFVALDLLKNANIAAGGVLPMCQDTGTAIVKGKKGQFVVTGGGDEEAIARGIFDTYQKDNLRYSQMAPLTLWDEKNTGTNLPGEIKISAVDGDAYKFLFMAKGGGSANKSFLFQETKAVLNPASLKRFLDDKLRLLGTSACPPYHLAVVIGGTSAESALETAKLASTRYLDTLPTEGSALGNGFRDLEMEAEVLKLTQDFGIGAQFGGKYFCHDVRVVRLPRHGASCPVAIAVSCSADRQALGKITADGVFLEDLERHPAQFLPEVTSDELGGDVVRIDLNRPMDEIRAELTKYPVKTRLSLTGTVVVARDIAHAKIAELLDAGGEMPQYLRDHPVYYAGPAKTPEGYASGSFGPTTAGRMDSYVEKFQAAGGSLVMLAKGNRSQQVTDACQAHGGFYLGSIGGPAARLAQDCIRHVEVLEYPELGMEAVWRIEVEDFPAFIVVDDKGHDFFAEVTTPVNLGTKG